MNGHVQVPDQRFEEDHHNSDEVCRVDNVELLEVLLVPECEGGREGRNIYMYIHADVRTTKNLLSTQESQNGSCNNTHVHDYSLFDFT